MAIDNKEYIELINEFSQKSKIQLEKKYKKLEKTRASFVNDFPIESIMDMKLEQYVCGIKKGNLGYDYHTFCYTVETTLKGLGNIKGATASKFGVYYSADKKRYIATKRFGENVDEAFYQIKSEIYKLLLSAQNNDFDEIDNCRLSHMFKLKIISTYFPEKYIPVFSSEHVLDFLQKLGIETTYKNDSIKNQLLLKDFKNSNNVTKDWSNVIFMQFLYNQIGYPGQQKTLDEKALNKYDKEYPNTYKYKQDITESQWLDMLNNEKIFHNEDIELLKQIYSFKYHATTCYELGLLNGVEPQSYNGKVVSLAKRIVNHMGYRITVPHKEMEGYWYELFWGRYTDNNLFEWKIRPELVKALETKFKDLKLEQINDQLDNQLNEDIKDTNILLSETPKYSDTIIKRKDAVIFKGGKVYKRDRKIAINALAIAHYCCEMNNNHKTFIRKSDGKYYTEPHHLIPMAFQDDFMNSLDIEENIVSLCSNCHNEIHYGQDAQILIEKLYNQRKEMLLKKGIDITLKDLLKYYGYKE